MRTKPLQTVVVGCGAITQMFHLPVLAGHAGFQVTTLVDTHRPSANKLAKAYRIPHVFTSISERAISQTGGWDAAILATPPASHAALAIEWMERGVSVFVEKPACIGLSELRQMLETSEKTGQILAVGYFRRLFPASRLLRELLQDEATWGKVTGFTAEEGSFFDWPSVTLGSMQKTSAGGGVVMDTGSHLLDQLLFFFGHNETIGEPGNPQTPQIREYRDDRRGGVEADATLRLEIPFRGEIVAGTVRLSRLATLKNQFRIETTRGFFTLRVNERQQVRFTPWNQETSQPVELVAQWESESSPTVFDSFRAELTDFHDAVKHRRPPFLAGKSALGVVSLIEECYRQPSLPKSSVGEEKWKAKTVSFGSLPSKPKILVTGATGFIGGRMVEMLLEHRDLWDVRAMVHQAAHASRLARTDVEMVSADLLDKRGLQKVVEGCDYIFHGAYGTALERKKSLATTIRGTRNIAQVARQVGVRGFFHCSTLAVCGTQLHGTFSPETPIQPDSYDYAWAKAKAEKQVRAEFEKGLSGAIFRLGNVYGPFSPPWTIRAVQTLAAGKPILLGKGETPSNTIFVDHVVYAMLCALRTMENQPENVRGKTFVLADEPMTWYDFYAPLAEALGVSMNIVSEETWRQWQRLRSPSLLKRGLDGMRDLADILTGEECKQFLIRVLTSRIGKPIHWFFYNVPGVRPLLRKILRLNRPEIYFPQTTSHQRFTQEELDHHIAENFAQYAEDYTNLFDIYGCDAVADDSQTRELLQYEPLYTREETIRMTLEWCRQAGLADHV